MYLYRKPSAVYNTSYYYTWTAHITIHIIQYSPAQLCSSEPERHKNCKYEYEEECSSWIDNGEKNKPFIHSEKLNVR